MLTDNFNIHNIYNQVVNLWLKFCEQHHLLLEITVTEFKILKENSFEKIEETFSIKTSIIESIKKLEIERINIINALKSEVNDPIENVTTLIQFFNLYENEIGTNYLWKYNQLLIDIIERIQEQNKVNQLRLNQAINNLDERRGNIEQQNTYHTYDANGLTKKNFVP